ncbi:MAG: DUF3429 domain-containing protein [Pseudomonadota bacterium]
MTELAQGPKAADVGLPQSAAVLAYAGALPLIVSALSILLRPDDIAATAAGFMVVYGGVLIAFFGGVRWGIAVVRPAGPSFAALIGGVLPLLAAMPIFFLEDMRVRLLIILIALPVLLVDDLRATRRGSGAPEWYLGVRTPLTILMEISFLVAFVFALRAA